MILGKVDFVGRESAYLAPALQRGLRYIARTDFAALPAGRQEIDGEAMFAMVLDYEPEPREKRRAEVHRKYIDIQYIVWGEELIGHAFLTDGLSPCEDLLANKDALLFDAVEGETLLRLTPGMYAVFFPWDVHRPGIVSAPGAPGDPAVTVRKVVVKLRV